MKKDLILYDKELSTNTATRLPIGLVLDCSPSMSGDPNLGCPVAQFDPRPIDELNEGIKYFFESVKEDFTASRSAEIAIIAFSGIAELVLDFNTIHKQQPPKLDVEMNKGGTSIGTAVKLALKTLDERLAKYKVAGVARFAPWLVLMTDGYPTDDTHFEVAKEVSRRILNEELTIFPIGIGKGADLNVLRLFSPKRVPVRLKGFRFRDFFEFLSLSAQAVSHSTPENPAPLDPQTRPEAEGWAETY